MHYANTVFKKPITIYNSKCSGVEECLLHYMCSNMEELCERPKPEVRKMYANRPNQQHFYWGKNKHLRVHVPCAIHKPTWHMRGRIIHTVCVHYMLLVWYCACFLLTVKVESAVIITFALHWIFLVKNENHYCGEKRYSISELLWVTLSSLL